MTHLRFVARMAWREGRATGRKLLFLTAAISVGVGALVAIESFTDNLRTAVEQQSRALLGGDIAARLRGDPTPAYRALLDSLTRAAGADPATDLSEVVAFSGMSYVPRTAGTRLVQVQAIIGGYPYYGSVKTEPAGMWGRLAEGHVALVDPSYLTALNAQVGDTMALGESRFEIVGTVTGFPGDVGVESAFGPKVYIPGQWVPETGLLTFGSRYDYDWYLRTPATTDVAALATAWRAKFVLLKGGLRTAAEEERDLKRFFDQLGRYLGLVALIALLLGGIGVGSAVQVFLRQKRDSIAVLRCLGATSGQVFGVYLAQAVVMVLAGSLAGVALGVVLQLGLPSIFDQFLPLDITVRPSWRAVGTGLGVGVWVATVFALLPLLDIRRIPPLAVLRRDVEISPTAGTDRLAWLARAALVLSVAGLAMLQVQSVPQGAVFTAAIGATLLLLWLAALGLIRALRRWFPHHLAYVYRQGLANLYRPANQTVAVVLALGFGAFLLGALAVMQHNLLRQLSLDGGLGRPNLVFFDIQPDQKEGVQQLIRDAGLVATGAVPIVPMRIRSINGRLASAILADTILQKADSSAREQGERGRRDAWAVRREFRSTYRDTVVASEKLVVGDWWTGRGGAPPPASASPVPISLEVEIAGDLDVTLRDTIVWDIQGVGVTSVITSLREVNWARFEPNFFVVFPDGPLNDAPQSFVVLTRVDSAAVLGSLQRAVVERYPNVTSVDLSAVQQTIEKVVGSVVLAIRFMALFSLATGTIVLVGALATSRFQRVREAALLKTLGATRRQVVRVMVTEYAALGLLATAVATVLASIGGAALTRWIFEIPFTVPWVAFLVLAAGLILLTVLTGIWTSLDVFRRPPIEVLRAE